MEDPHSPAASMRMSKLPVTDSARQKARIFQIDVSGAFPQKQELEAESSSLYQKCMVKSSHNSRNNAAHQFHK
jgi:hypothetical protein